MTAFCMRSKERGNFTLARVNLDCSDGELNHFGTALYHLEDIWWCVGICPISLHPSACLLGNVPVVCGTRAAIPGLLFQNLVCIIG